MKHYSDQGSVNVMTSGGDIAQAEETLHKNSGHLNAVQLWIALPDSDPNGQASIQHIEEVPIIEQGDGVVSVFAGSVLSFILPSANFVL